LLIEGFDFMEAAKLALRGETHAVCGLKNPLRQIHWEGPMNCRIIRARSCSPCSATRNRRGAWRRSCRSSTTPKTCNITKDDHRGASVKLSANESILSESLDDYTQKWYDWLKRDSDGETFGDIQHIIVAGMDLFSDRAHR